LDIAVGIAADKIACCVANPQVSISKYLKVLQDSLLKKLSVEYLSIARSFDIVHNP
jgi:hypothetical protein